MVLERATVADFEADPVLRLEHYHRYTWASQLAHGRVLDAGCGAGAFSRFLANAPAVTNWVGVDAAAEAITAIGTDGVSGLFVQAKLERLPFAAGYFDCVVALEVLEHTDDPALAIGELRRVLRSSGCLFGSIPTLEKETYLSERWGGNAFHISDPLQVYRCLQATFKHLRFGFATLEIGSVLQFDDLVDADIDTALRRPEEARLGTLVFVASDKEIGARNTRASIVLGVNEVTFLGAVTKPFEAEIRHSGTLVAERDAYIIDLEQRILSLKQEPNEAAPPVGSLEQLAEDLRKSEAVAEHHRHVEAERHAREIAQINAIVLARDRYIVKLEDDLVACRAARETTDALVAARDANIARLETDLSALKMTRETSAALVEERDRYITALETNVIALRATLEADARRFQAALAASDLLVQERDAYLTKLEADIVAFRSALAAADLLVRERDDYIAVLDAKSRALAAAWATAGDQLQEQARVSRELNSEISIQRALVQNADTLAQSQKNEVENLKNEINRIRNIFPVKLFLRIFSSRPTGR